MPQTEIWSMETRRTQQNSNHSFIRSHQVEGLQGNRQIRPGPDPQFSQCWYPIRLLFSPGPGQGSRDIIRQDINISCSTNIYPFINRWFNIMLQWKKWKSSTAPIISNLIPISVLMIVPTGYSSSDSRMNVSLIIIQSITYLLIQSEL